MGFEGLGGFDEAADELGREGVGVLGVGREAVVVGAVIGEFMEADGGGGGGGRDRSTEFLNVEWRVDQDYVESPLL